MTWLWILAIVAQSADAGYSCHALHHGARELNPLLGQSCARIVVTKASMIGVVPLLPEPSQKWMLGALVVSGGVGVSVSIALK